MKDKLFLLSANEVEKYLPDEKSRICKCRWDDASCHWWLRSPGCDTSLTDLVAFVEDNGSLRKGGCFVQRNDTVAVRPALHVNTSYLQSLMRTDKGYVGFGRLEWIVLDEETGLLLSKDAIGRRSFANSDNYELSGIRKFLNNKMINDFFTVEEQEMIMDTVIDGEASYPDLEAAYKKNKTCF